MAEKNYLRNAEFLTDLIIQAISPMQALVDHLDYIFDTESGDTITPLIFPAWDLTKKNLQTLMNALEDSLGSVKIIVAPKPGWYNEMPRYCFGKVLLDNEFYKKPKKEEAPAEEAPQGQEQLTN